MMEERLLQDCTLCPRQCHVNRISGKKGYCGMDTRIRAARAALHMWEEPCISGEKGSGAVIFFRLRVALLLLPEQGHSYW